MPGSLRHWLRKERLRGRSPMESLLVRLPRRAAMEAGLILDRALWRRFVLPRHATGLARCFRQAAPSAGPDSWYLIGVPDVLHFLIPCLRLATRRVPVVVLMNGLRGWEEEALAEALPDIPRVRIPTPRAAPLEHGLVLEAVLRLTEGDVRLHDPDLYVLDPSVYGELRLRDGEAAAGAYGVANERARLIFPTTHLLTLRGSVLRDLMRRHGIGPGRYRTTPRHLSDALGRLNLGDHNLPKTYLGYYDVLTLLLAAAASEGHRLRSLQAGDDRVFHVGGVSYLTDNYHLDYLHHRFLALPTAAPFAACYRSMLRTPTLEDARARFRGPRAEDQLRRIDASMERLEAEL